MRTHALRLRLNYFMTLSKEDVDKFTERLRSMPYWDLWDCVDEDWKRLYDPTDPFSSWEEELMGMTYIEIRSRHKKMKPLELINKKTKRLLSQIYKPVRIFWLQRRFNIIVCSPLLISLYIFGIEPTVTFIAYVLGNIWLLWLLVYSPIKFLLRGTEKTKNPIIKKIRAPFSMIGDALNNIWDKLNNIMSKL